MQRLLPLLALLLMAATPALAQRSSTNGFNIGLHLNGSSITIEEFGFDDETNSGGGGGLVLGYGFGERAALYLNFDGAAINADEADEYTLGHGDLGVLLHFGSPYAALRPYVDLGLTGRVATFQTDIGDVNISGGALTVGGGLKYFFTPGLALDAALKLSFGQFTEVELNGRTADIDDIDANTGRFNIGLVWYPNR